MGLIQEREGGRITNISSGAALLLSPRTGIYEATKIIVNALAVTLAQGMTTDTRAISTINPGAIITKKAHEIRWEYGMGCTEEEVEVVQNGMRVHSLFQNGVRRRCRQRGYLFGHPPGQLGVRSQCPCVRRLCTDGILGLSRMLRGLFQIIKVARGATLLAYLRPGT